MQSAGVMAMARSTAEPAFQFGRERRMHARAYDYWVSLLRGRRMPQVSEMDPDEMRLFADRSVLVDLPVTGAPVIAHLGMALRDEAGVAAFRPAIEDIPDRTLLHALLRRLPDIVAHQAPTGFEAEFEGRRGGTVLHRGILLPFADDRGVLASIYGVISWKQVEARMPAPDVASAVASAIATRPAAPPACAWGDGPSAALIARALPPQPLEHQLRTARTWAALAETDRMRGDASVHAALSAAYDYLLAARKDGPLTTGAVVRAVFGREIGRLDRIRFTATLDHALRLGQGAGRVAPWLDGLAGGYVAAARGERLARRAARHAYVLADLQGWAALQPAIGHLELKPVDAELLLLVGRRARDGVDVIAAVDDQPRLTGMAAARARRG